MKVRVVCRKIYDYIRYDLKEIAFPSSLPDPPHIKKRRKLTWDQRIWVCPFSLFTFTFTLGLGICYFSFNLILTITKNLLWFTCFYSLLSMLFVDYYVAVWRYWIVLNWRDDTWLLVFLIVLRNIQFSGFEESCPALCCKLGSWHWSWPSAWWL